MLPQPVQQSLEREASSFEARLMAARADLQKADDVRSSLERSRDEDEVLHLIPTCP